MNPVKLTPVLTLPHTQTEYLRVLINQMDLHIKGPNLAERLSHYAHNWKLVTHGLAGYHWLPIRAYPNPTPGETNPGSQVKKLGSFWQKAP